VAPPSAPAPGDPFAGESASRLGSGADYRRLALAGSDEYRLLELAGYDRYQHPELVGPDTYWQPERVGSDRYRQPERASNDENRLLELARQAESAYQQGLWADAAVLYESVLQSVPQDPYLWFRLGNTLTRLGHYLQAIQAFESSLQRDSSQPKPWFNLSTTYLLSAQMATLGALGAVPADHPAHGTLQGRLDALSQLLQGESIKTADVDI
jgi:tetratricopeptide (TPR) repeat protein